MHAPRTISQSTHPLWPSAFPFRDGALVIQDTIFPVFPEQYRNEEEEGRVDNGTWIHALRRAVQQKKQGKEASPYPPPVAF